MSSNFAPFTTHRVAKGILLRLPTLGCFWAVGCIFSRNSSSLQPIFKHHIIPHHFIPQKAHPIVLAFNQSSNWKWKSTSKNSSTRSISSYSFHFQSAEMFTNISKLPLQWSVVFKKNVQTAICRNMTWHRDNNFMTSTTLEYYFVAYKAISNPRTQMIPNIYRPLLWKTDLWKIGLSIMLIKIWKLQLYPFGTWTYLTEYTWSLEARQKAQMEMTSMWDSGVKSDSKK